MFLASADAIGLLFGCLFIYAVAGVMMFGGLIFDGNDALDDTDYRDSGYDGRQARVGPKPVPSCHARLALPLKTLIFSFDPPNPSLHPVFNFNDHGLALVSLFANLITGFVPEFYEAYTTVSEHAMFAVCFWVSFYVVGVLASFNIFGRYGITGSQDQTGARAHAPPRACTVQYATSYPKPYPNPNPNPSEPEPEPEREFTFFEPLPPHPRVVAHSRLAHHTSVADHRHLPRAVRQPGRRGRGEQGDRLSSDRTGNGCLPTHHLKPHY